MQEGKISVIMAIYNCADYLSEAIDSILAQTYTNWELILCDVASTDNTYQLALKYQQKYPDKTIWMYTRSSHGRMLTFRLSSAMYPP